MKFSIHLGIPETLALWTKLKKDNSEGAISKSDARLYKKWGKAMKLLAEDPFYQSLNAHEISDLTKRYGVKVWQKRVCKYLSFEFTYAEEEFICL